MNLLRLGGSRTQQGTTRAAAEEHEKAGRLEMAAALYRQSVAGRPDDWITIRKVGDLLTRLSLIEEAVQEYATFAEMCATEGSLRKAVAVWKQIQKLAPAALDPHANLADLYAKLGLRVEAKQQYYIVLDEHKMGGRIEDAAEVLSKIAEMDPDDLKAQSMLAYLYQRQGNTDRAIEIHIAISQNLSEKGHLREALQVLEKGLEIDPGSRHLRTELARVHVLENNWEKAVRALEEVLHESPSDSAVQLSLGKAYLGAERLEEAERIFLRLLQQDPRQEEARIQLARIELLKGHVP